MPRTDRINLNLPARARDALDDALELGGDNITDTVSRALILYANHLRNEANGGHTIVHMPDGTHLRWLIL